MSGLNNNTPGLSGGARGLNDGVPGLYGGSPGLIREGGGGGGGGQGSPIGLLLVLTKAS